MEARYRLAATAFYQVRTEGRATAVEWRAVADTFQRLQVDAPKHHRAADAQFSAGVALREAFRLSHDPKDWQAALRTFQRFVTSYPRHPLAADSLVHEAEMQQQDRQDLDAAAYLYRQVLAHFGGSDLAALAQQRLRDLPAPPEKNAAGNPMLARSAPAAPSPAQPVRFAEGEGPTVAPPAAQSAAQLVVNEPASVMPGGDASPPGRSGIGPSTAEPAPPAADARAAGKAATVPASGPARLKRMQVLSALQFTRVILTTSRPVRTHVKAEGGGTSLRLELSGTQPDAGFTLQQPLLGGAVESVQLRDGRKGVALLLKLRSLQKQEVKTFDLPNETKIVLDVYPKPRAAAALASAAAPVPLASPAAPAPRPGPAPAAPGERISLKESLGLKVRAVMLDAGHGGHDPGAMAFGLQEKDLTLGIARHLRDLIKQRHPGLRVGMTREDDATITLAKRPQLAKAFGADLFVSIHLNANPQERFRGVETYFLNLTSDASALQVAARENATSQKKVSDLNVILLDLLRDTNILESSKLAEALQTGLVSALKPDHGVRNLGVKQAPFMVLIGAEMPSVLVEAGFVTNRAESRLLQNPDYQDQIAQGIYAGLGQYIAGDDSAAARAAAFAAPSAPSATSAPRSAATARTSAAARSSSAAPAARGASSDAHGGALLSENGR